MRPQPRKEGASDQTNISSRIDHLLEAYADLVLSGDSGDGEEAAGDLSDTLYCDRNSDGLYADARRVGKKDQELGGYTLEEVSEVIIHQAAKEYDDESARILHRLSVSTVASSYGSALPSGYLDFRLFGDSTIELTLNAPFNYPRRQSNGSGRSSSALSVNSSPPTLLFNDEPISGWFSYSNPSLPPSPQNISHPVVEVAAHFSRRPTSSTLFSRPTLSSRRTVSFQSTLSSDTTKPENKVSKSSIVAAFKSKFRKARAISAPTKQTNSFADFHNIDKVINEPSLLNPTRPKLGSSIVEIVHTALDAIATTGSSLSDCSNSSSPPQVAEDAGSDKISIYTIRRPSKALPERPELAQSDTFFRDPWTPRTLSPSSVKTPEPPIYRSDSPLREFSAELRGKVSVLGGSRSAPESPASLSASFAGYQIISKRATYDGASRYLSSTITGESLVSKPLPSLDYRNHRASYRQYSPVVPQKDNSLTTRPSFVRFHTHSGMPDMPAGGMFRNPFEK